MIVMIDNYDSFTYNLYQYITEIAGEVLVYRHDQVTVPDIEKLSPEAIVLSPGPGSPVESGICKDVLQHFYRTTPVIGICLGHQIIVETFGGQVEKGKKPMHGKVTSIKHDGMGIFQQIPSPTCVTRYHSLVASVVPDCLEVSAVAEDGAIMGVRHKEYQIEGIQFHPEAILTEQGYKMLENFFMSIRIEESTKGRKEQVR